MIAERKAIGLRTVDIGHVADGAGLDQRANHRGAERAGSAGHDDMAVAIIHRLLPLLQRTSHHRPAARPMQGRILSLDATGAMLCPGAPCSTIAQRCESAGMADFDLAIVGGGINGTGIARDAAGRGLRVLLVEQNDLASGTSSASTKLIHGGLRYLEHGWFRLVREALIEREVMLRMAPHLIRPMRFVLPAEPGMRPRLDAAPGTVRLRSSRRAANPAARPAAIDLTNDPLGAPLKRRYEHGFEYSDCFADDSRLVVLNAVDAAERGAVIRTRTRCIRAERGAVWRLVLEVRGRRDRRDRPRPGQRHRTMAQAVCGQCSAMTRRRHRHGSTRVATSWCDACSTMIAVIIVQTRDGRFVFALPFERDFTLIGTTDQGFAGDPSGIKPDADEIAYLCDVANQHFRADRQPRRRGLVVCRRPLALRRRLQKGAGRKPRLCSEPRATRPRGAAADRLWRQDHDLSAPGRACARPACPCRRGRTAMDQGLASARAANFRTTASRPSWPRRAIRGRF